MKIETVSVKSIITNRDSLHAYFAWPTVTRLRDGRLAAAASGFRYYHKCPFGKDVISFSEDEGETWSIPAITFDTPLDDRDSGLTPFGESGLLVTSCNNGPKSHVILHGCDRRPELKGYIQGYLDLMNGERTEEELRRYAGSLYRISHDNGRTFGGILHAPVSSPHGPLALPDGSFLWVGNRIDGTGAGLGKRLYCFRVFEDGSSEYLSDIEPIGGNIASYEPYAFITHTGKLIVHIRAEAPKACEITQADDVFTIYQSESADGGRTFTKPHSIGMESSGGAPAHIVEQDGVLISVSGHRAAPHQIRAAFSFDDGETWDSGHVVLDLSDMFEDFGYPSSVILKDGSVLTVFYGADEGAPNRTFWAGKDTPIYEFTTPVVRQVRWRWTRD